MGVWFWCTDQSMVQSVLGAKNLRQGQLGANFCGWLKLMDIPLFILPGILCFVLLPHIARPEDAYLSLVQAVLPAGLIGLVVVVMVAALISTIASALNSLSTVFTMDIYAKRREGTTPHELNRVGRVVTLAGALLAVFLAFAITQIQGLSFFNVFQSVLSFLAPPMAVAFLFSVLWKRTTTRAINLLLTLGTAFSIGIGCFYLIVKTLYGGGSTSALVQACAPFVGIHFMLISFFIFALLAAATLTISLCKPERQSQNTLSYAAFSFKPNRASPPGIAAQKKDFAQERETVICLQKLCTFAAGKNQKTNPLCSSLTPPTTRLSKPCFRKNAWPNSLLARCWMKWWCLLSMCRTRTTKNTGRHPRYPAWVS